MNRLISILSILGLLTSCNPTDNQKKDSRATKSKTDSLVHIESFYIDQSEVNSNRYKEFYACPFDKFINDPKTSQLAKDIYLDNEWNLNNDEEALALLDSLTAMDKSSRQFYFKVVTLTYDKADGYFSEGLGNAGKEYVENNTHEFATHFDNNECCTNQDLETWAKIVMLEFSLIFSETEHKAMMDDFIKKLNKECTACSENQKETIKRFGAILNEEWKEFLIQPKRL